jgi:transposase-like protein
MKTKQKPQTKGEINLVNLIERFGSEDKCRSYLEELRWPDGVECPRCKCHEVVKVNDRHQYDCSKCGYQFSVTVGSIFHDTHLPLWKWFLAVYLMTESRKSMSALQLKRSLSVAYKTAWYLCHRIRAAMGQACEAEGKMGGTIEADETLIGGKAKGKGRGYLGNKAHVAGVVERGGRVRLKVISDRTRESLHKFLEDHVDRAELDKLYTDEWEAYKGFTPDHESVCHSLEEWARGDVHTNSVEGVWSLLKRAIIGAYHRISHKHLDAYLDELEWRFGNRHNAFLFRDTIAAMLRADKLEYSKLTAG